MKTLVSVKLLSVLAIAAILVIGFTACNPDPGGDDNLVETIDIRYIIGVTPPVRGATPAKNISESFQYTGTITWSPNHTTFQDSTVYTAIINLVPKAGFTLKGVEENFFAVYRAETTHAANSGFITAVFPVTKDTDDAVDIQAIGGVTPPATGGIPAKNISPNEQFKGSISWQPDHTVFQAGTSYTATVELTAETGYTFNGVEENFFRIANAETTNPANSSSVTAVFPATGGSIVNVSKIWGVIPPAIGTTPVTAITASLQYTGTVTWQPNHTTFQAGQAYTATITLNVISPFDFTGISANFFEVAGATTTNAADSGIVSAVFPQLGAVYVSFPEIHFSILKENSNNDNAPTNTTRVNYSQWNSSRVEIKNPTDSGFAYGIIDEGGSVRGRGNSTWNNMGAKRPYRFRFASAQPTLGSDYSARLWILLANTIDYSNMRNYGSYYLGQLLDGMYFSPSTKFVHVFLNSPASPSYQGVYLLTDEREAGPGRVQLITTGEPNVREYLIEYDRHTWVTGEAHFAVNHARENVRIPFNFRDPAEPTQQHKDFAQSFIQNVYNAIASRDFAQISAVIDLPSFVDFYIVQELFKNRDVGYSSLFFQIKHKTPGTNSPYLVAGPLWDFDQSSGSVVDGAYNDSPTQLWAAGASGSEGNVWFRNLLETPEFRQLVDERWDTVKNREVRQMIDQIKYMSRLYETCFNRNYTATGGGTRYQIGDNIWRTPQNIRNIKTYLGQVDYLINWLEQRIVWFDGWL